MSISEHKCSKSQPQDLSAVRGICFFLLFIFCSVFVVSLFSDFLPAAAGAYADQRFFQVFLLVGVIVVSLGWRGGGEPCTRPLVSIWPALLVAISFVLLSLPFASNEFNWVEPGLYAFFFIAFAILGWRIHEERAGQIAVEILVFASSVACFFYASMTMTVYLFAITDRFAALTDIIPWGFVNMRYWSHMATWLLPILPLALLVGPLAQNRKWQWGVSFAAGIWWWMVFMTMARGTLMSLVLASVLASIVFRKALIPWLRISFRFVFFGGVAWVLLSLLIPSIVFEEVTIRSLHAGSSGRVPLWWEAWRMSLESFPLGQGPQSWLTHAWMTDQSELSVKFAHPHNMYLMWAAEYGWALVGVLLVLVFCLFKDLLMRVELLESTSVDKQSSLIAFTVSVVAGLTHAGFSAVFIVPASMLVGLCVLSLFWALIQPEKRPESLAGEVRAGLWRGPICRLALLAILVLGGGDWAVHVWEYHRAMEEDLVTYEQGSEAAYFPRFWFHGNFPRVE